MDDDPQILDFTPVPRTRRRGDGWTPDRQRGFLVALAQAGSVSAAARSQGMSARTAYRLRDQAGAESFADAWDHALDQGYDRARAVAIDRALNGVAKPVFYRGRQVGERRVYNDRLLVAVLAGRGHAIEPHRRPLKEPRDPAWYGPVMSSLLAPLPSRPPDDDADTTPSVRVI